MCLCKGLREETERLEAARDKFQAEAIAMEEERASELDCLRREAADLSLRLEVRFCCVLVRHEEPKLEWVYPGEDHDRD